jgi:hypothetical protein
MWILHIVLTEKINTFTFVDTITLIMKSRHGLTPSHLWIPLCLDYLHPVTYTTSTISNINKGYDNSKDRK